MSNEQKEGITKKFKKASFISIAIVSACVVFVAVFGIYILLHVIHHEGPFTEGEIVQQEINGVLYYSIIGLIIYIISTAPSIPYGFIAKAIGYKAVTKSRYGLLGAFGILFGIMSLNIYLIYASINMIRSIKYIE